MENFVVLSVIENWQALYLFFHSLRVVWNVSLKSKNLQFNYFKNKIFLELLSSRYLSTRVLYLRIKPFPNP